MGYGLWAIRYWRLLAPRSSQSDCLALEPVWKDPQPIAHGP